jgi:predicted N-acetyltransferase YhbS
MSTAMTTIETMAPIIFGETSLGQISLGQGRPEELWQISKLLDLAFGAKRHRKTAYRLRDGVSPLAPLWFVARAGDMIVGSIQYWPVMVDDWTTGESQQVLLLGPIAVDPALRSQGVGAALIEASLKVATDMGHGQVILVGDEPYYSRMGFSAQATGGLGMPGPFDPARLLSRQLNEGPALPALGMIRHIHAAPELPAFAEPSHGGQAEQQQQASPSGQQRRLAHA